MSVVIVYDHFIARGGAENVSLSLCNELGEAHIESAYVDNKLFEMELKNEQLKPGKFRPGEGPLNSFRLLLFYLLNYCLPNTRAAMISGLFAPLCLLRRQKPGRKIVYFHMFPVFLEWSFAELRSRYGVFLALLALGFITTYRILLCKSVERADMVFSNSRQAQQKFHQAGIRTSLLYPPVKTGNIAEIHRDGFFLSTARLEETKRVRLIADTFVSLPDKEVVFVGGGSLLDEFKRIYAAYKNIRFVGWVPLEDVQQFYAKAQCLIYVPENEAFGIAPIEALASGIPVIGVAEAGLLETIVDDRLGTLIPLPLTRHKLAQVICRYHNKVGNLEEIRYRRKYALQFDETVFYSEITAALGDVYEKAPDV